MERWQRQGWRLTDGGTVKNLDLVKRLWQHKQGQRTIKVIWIPRWKNEEADQLAKQGSRAAKSAGKGKGKH
jgi:ribonuclease HI